MTCTDTLQYFVSQSDRDIASKEFFLLRKQMLSPSITLHVSFYIHNILAFSSTGRGNTQESVWDSQRYQTVRLCAFEVTAYRPACKVFWPLVTFSLLWIITCSELAQMTIRPELLVFGTHIVKVSALMQLQMHCFGSRSCFVFAEE